MPLFVAGAMRRLGIGARGPVRGQSVLRERVSGADGTAPSASSPRVLAQFNSTTWPSASDTRLARFIAARVDGCLDSSLNIWGARARPFRLGASDHCNLVRPFRAFSSEVVTGSREENARQNKNL